MKKRILTALLAACLCLGAASAAQSYKKSIEVEYGIGLTINGTSAVLKDPNGNTVQPFTYNGTTYVPIRAVSDHLGASVGYDAKNNTASINGNASLTEDDDFKKYIFFLHSVENASYGMYVDLMNFSSYAIKKDFSLNMNNSLSLAQSSMELVKSTLSHVPSSSPYYYEAASIAKSFYQYATFHTNCITAYTNHNFSSLGNSFLSASDAFSKHIASIRSSFAKIAI